MVADGSFGAKHALDAAALATVREQPDKPTHTARDTPYRVYDTSSPAGSNFNSYFKDCLSGGRAAAPYRRQAPVRRIGHVHHPLTPPPPPPLRAAAATTAGNHGRA